MDLSAHTRGDHDAELYLSLIGSSVGFRHRFFVGLVVAWQGTSV